MSAAVTLRTCASKGCRGAVITPCCLLVLLYVCVTFMLEHRLRAAETKALSSFHYSLSSVSREERAAQLLTTLKLRLLEFEQVRLLCDHNVLLHCVL